MRGLKSTIALVVVLIGLGAYIYFVTWKKPAETTNQEKVFASLQSDAIDSITVKSAGGDTTTLQKTGGSWALTAPIDAKADEAEVSGMTSNLASLDVVRVIDEHPKKLTDYGLEKPRIVIDFKTGGKAQHKLLIGDKTPTGSDLFARRDDAPRVFLIPAFQETTFNHSTFELRDKTLMTFDRDKVDGVTVDASGAKPVVVGKQGNDWKLEKPVQAPADDSAVEGLIGRLQSVQMKSIVSDAPTPADLKKYGFDKPQATVTLQLGSARAALVLGDKAQDTTTVYARDTSRPMVMTVESALLDDLKKGPDELRKKDIFDFRAYNATKLEVSRAGQTVAFEKVKGQGKDAQETWRRGSPNPKDVDKDTMDGFLTKLANMRASSFEDSTAGTGLDKPALTVHVTFDDGTKQERVTFGKTGSGVFASRPDEPGAAKVDATDFDAAVKQLDELSK